MLVLASLVLIAVTSSQGACYLSKDSNIKALQTCWDFINNSDHSVTKL